MKYRPIQASLSDNCTTCAHFVKCKSPDKSWSFACHRYEMIEMAASTTVARVKNKVKRTGHAIHKTNETEEIGRRILASELDVDETELPIAKEDQSGRDFRKYLRSLGKNKAVILHDARVDDRDFKTAPNYFTWCTGKRYLNSEPFAKQLQIGIEFFAEWCPKCSDGDYVRDVPFDERDLGNLRDRIQFFSHGVCKKCNYTRAEAIRDGELNLHNDLVVVAGQRSGKCIPGDAWVLTDRGYTLMSNVAGGDGKIALDENGVPHTITNRWNKKRKYVFEILTTDGGMVPASAKHPIMTGRNWVPTRELQIGEGIPVYANNEMLFPTTSQWYEAYRHRLPSIWNEHHRLLPSRLVDTMRKMGAEQGRAFLHGITPNRMVVRGSLTEWAMRLPWDFWSEFFREQFMPNYSPGGALVARYDNSVVPRQIKMILAQAGIVARVIGRLVVVEGRMTLRMLRRIGAFEQSQTAYLSREMYRNQHSWYDTVPISVCLGLHGMITSAVHEMSSLHRNTLRAFLPGSTTLAAQSQMAFYAERIKDGNVNRNELRSLLLMQIGELRRWFGPVGRMLETYVRQLLDPNLHWTEVESVKPRGKEEVYDIEVENAHRFMANGFLVHNSISLSQLVSYTNHKFLMLRNPSKYLGILDNTILHGNVVALTYAQAKDGVWDPLSEILSDSPWYNNYHAFLKDRGEYLGEELLRHKETFVYYRHRGLQMGPAAANRGTLRGRCLTGSTLVNTNLGFTSLSELCSKRMGFTEVSNLNVDSHRGSRQVSHTYRDRSETIKIRTRNGFEIEGTPEHPLLVIDSDLRYKWCRLDRLKEGDWIVSRTANSEPLFGRDNRVSSDMATILGYLTANGYYETLSSNDEAVIERFNAAVEREVGVTPHRTRTDHSVRAESHGIFYGNRGQKKMPRFFNGVLNPLGYTATRSSEKEIPISVRMAPREILHEYLEAYFECDSGINGDGTGKCAGPGRIELSSASQTLIEQLQVILLQVYGIVGRRQMVTNYDVLDRSTGKFDSRRDYWILSLSGADAISFLEAFKRAKVHKYAHRLWEIPPGYQSDRRKVPWIGKYLWQTYEASRLKDDTGKRYPWVVATDGTLIKNRVKPACFASLKASKWTREHFSEALIYEDDWNNLLPLIKRINPLAHKRVQKVVDMRAHYEEVVSIERSSKEKIVYDLTVPQGHAFTANGLSSHNTRYWAAIDELGWFNGADGSVRVDGLEIHKALSRSLQTVRSATRRLVKRGTSDFPIAGMYNISSPSHINDPIMSLMRKGERVKSIYSMHYATWEFNPEITFEDLADEFASNPSQSWRDFGARPPMSTTPFVENIDDFKNVISRNHTNAGKVIQGAIKTTSGRRLTSGKVDFSRGWTDDKVGKLLTIDPGFSHNCLAGDTLVLTRKGTRRIEELEGQVEILTSGQKWVYGNFRCYGKAPVMEVELTRDGITKVIKATPNHRWFSHRRDGDIKETTTDKLKPGHYLEYVLPPAIHEGLKIDPSGVENGVVFGDGTTNRGDLNKKKIIVGKLPLHYKEVPDISSDPSYLLGFLSGYIATDGTVGPTGNVIIDCYDEDALIKVRDIASVLGITSSPIRLIEYPKSTIGKGYGFRLVFHKEGFPDRILLNPAHKAARKASGDSKRIRVRWQIKSVKAVEGKEKVYCASVPDTHSFVLDDYILTGNSFAFSVSHIDPELGPVFDFFGEIIPKADRPISFPGITRMVLKELIQKMGVRVIASDRWQNIHLMQELEESEGVAYVEYRLRYNDFTTWRDALQQGEFILPPPEMKFDDVMEVNSSIYPDCFEGKPIAHLIYQAMTVQDVPGKTVDKGMDTTDDLFRTMVLGYTLLMNDEIAPVLTGPLRGKGTYGIAAMAGGSGGGGGGSSTGSVGIAIGGGGGGGASSVNSGLGAVGGKK